jgi:hypothetical protein
MDGVRRKHNATFLNLQQYAYPKQNTNITVDRADVALRLTCYLANSHSSLAGHELEQRPPFGRQRLPEKVFRRE